MLVRCAYDCGMWVIVCIFIRMCTYIYVYIYKYLTYMCHICVSIVGQVRIRSVYIYTYVAGCGWLSIYIHMCLCIYVDISIYVCIRIYMYSYICMHIYIYVYICIYVYTYELGSLYHEFDALYDGPHRL